RIYALKEQNNDRIYNGNDEWIGFLADSLVLNKDINGVALELTKGYQKDYRTLEKRVDNTGYILLTFTKPLQQPEVEILAPQALNNTKTGQQPADFTLTVTSECRCCLFENTLK